MRLIDLEKPKTCKIIRRLNRFVVEVRDSMGVAYAHINNTGRLLEYIREGNTAYCIPHQGKTQYHLIAVEDELGVALIDTQLQMKSFEVAVKNKLLEWAPCEIKSRSPILGGSRLDYLLICGGRETYTELKSAVLREGEFAMYPDCPTLRGRRHIQELIRHSESGGKSLIVFVAGLRGVKAFKPYERGDPEIGKLLRKARESGVEIRAFSIFYDPDTSNIMLERSNLEISL